LAAVVPDESQWDRSIAAAEAAAQATLDAAAAKTNKGKAKAADEAKAKAKPKDKGYKDWDGHRILLQIDPSEMEVDEVTGKETGKHRVVTSFPAISSACRNLSLKPREINDALRGKEKVAGGYIWKWSTEVVSKEASKKEKAAVKKEREASQTCVNVPWLERRCYARPPLLHYHYSRHHHYLATHPPPRASQVPRIRLVQERQPAAALPAGRPQLAHPGGPQSEVCHSGRRDGPREDRPGGDDARALGCDRGRPRAVFGVGTVVDHRALGARVQGVVDDEGVPVPRQRPRRARAHQGLRVVREGGRGRCCCC